MKHFLIYTAVLLLVSCKQEIIVNIEDKPALTVVVSELDKDSFFTFRLSLTQNITDNSPEKHISDAVIEILDKDSNLLESLQHSSGGMYKSALIKPVPASRYLIRIKDSRGEHFADETMPTPIQILSLDTARIQFQGQKDFMQLKLVFPDTATQGNYYGLRLKRTFVRYSGTDSVLSDEWLNIETGDLIITEDPDSRFSLKHRLFSDRFFNGNVQEIKFGASGLFGKPDEKTKSLELHFSSYSQPSFRFLVSVNEHLFYQNDPFSQPSGIRGNVSNAAGGVVAQYTIVKRIAFP